MTDLSSAYSEEFKRDAVRAVRAEEGSAAAIAKRVGCSASSLRKWVELFADEDLDEPAGEDIDQAAADVDGELDLFELGARVLAVVGPFGSRVLVDMPTRLAERLFPEPLSAASPTRVSEGVERDVAAIASADEDLARSGLAGAARALALEIENPYNSATAKASCAGQLRESLDRLRELAPPEEEKDRLDALRTSRDERRAGSTAT